MSNIIITKSGSLEKMTGPEAFFTGEVAVQMVQQKRDDSRMSVGRVTFQPGARTAWHTHPYGQLLIIMEGRGRVCEWGGPVRDVEPGDTVWFPAGLKHWHGAAEDTAMSHFAIQEEQDGSAVTWMDKVTDEQYRSE